MNPRDQRAWRRIAIAYGRLLKYTDPRGIHVSCHPYGLSKTLLLAAGTPNGIGKVRVEAAKMDRSRVTLEEFATWLEHVDDVFGTAAIFGLVKSLATRVSTT